MTTLSQANATQRHKRTPAAGYRPCRSPSSARISYGLAMRRLPLIRGDRTRLSCRSRAIPADRSCIRRLPCIFAWPSLTRTSSIAADRADGRGCQAFRSEKPALERRVLPRRPIHLCHGVLRHGRSTRERPHLPARSAARQAAIASGKRVYPSYRYWASRRRGRVLITVLTWISASTTGTSWSPSP